MAENKTPSQRKIYKMKNIKIRNIEEIIPIEWNPYTGETVVVKTIIRGGKKIQETAFYEDKVKAVPQGNAYIIGNGPSRKNFDLTLLKDSGQTYGCNALYRDFTPDYLFMVDSKISKGIIDDQVYKKCICYAPSLEVNRYPEKLHLIPNNPHWASGQQAVWTACVHGHKNLYLLGFDFREYGENKLNNIYQDTDYYGERKSDLVFEAWLKQFRTLIKQRPYCNFTVVHDNPPEYLNHLQTGTDLKNTRSMNYKEFTEKVLGR
jgi:hypothetical protein